MGFIVVVNAENLSNRLDPSHYSPDDLDIELLLKKNSYDYLINRIIKIAGGATPKGAIYRNKGIAFIRTQNIQDNMINDEDLVYISTKDNESLKRSELQEEDVLLTITGVYLGHSAVVEKEVLPANINQHSVKIQTKDIDPYYLSVYLNSKYGQSQIWRRVYGATRPAINYDEIKEIIIPIASHKFQIYIREKILKAIKLKKEAKELQKKLNQLLIDKLGTIPQEIFIQDKWSEIDAENLSDRLDSRYYSKTYLEIEKLLKLKGEVTKLSNICEQISQGYNKSSFKNGKSTFAIGVGDFGEITPLKNKEKEVEVVSEKKLRKFDIVWCNTAHLPKYIGEKINFILDDATFVPTTEVTFVRPIVEKINPYYLYAFLTSSWGYYQIQRSIRGLVARSHAEDNKDIIVPILNFTEEELDILKEGIEKTTENNLNANLLINEAKREIELLIENNFNESKIIKIE